MPGLRIACLVSPAPFRERLEAAKRSVDLSSNGLMQRVLERFIASGSLDSHLAHARVRYRQAWDAFASGLASCGIDGADGLHWESPEGGMNAWLELPAGCTAREVAAACLQNGCAVLPEAEFRLGVEPVGEEDRHLRVSFGSPPLDDVRKGTRQIVETLSSLSQVAGKRI
jgi:DNA-binding transcriptional MocR family regulator